jgi:iron complex outermembrane recepter protein
MTTKQSLPVLLSRAASIASGFWAALAFVSATAQTDNTATGGDVVTLSAFQVSTTADVGYRVGNSVSATRISTPIKDLPFAISAFTPQFISDTASRDLYDVVRFAAGVTSGAREFNAGNAVYTIRGFPQPPEHDGFFESAQGNVYVDTVAIDRVEVVKGPASLLYGQIAPGGTVNYITKRAQPKAFTALVATVGSYDYWRGTIDVNEPLVSNTLLFRFNAAWENGFEYAHPSKMKTTVLVPTLTWNIAKNLSLTVNYQSFHRHENPPAVYYPNTEVSTPSSMVSALNGAVGYPGPASALTGKTGPDAAAGFGSDASDPGFLPFYPALPRKFNYNGANDWRKANLETLNAELTAKLSDRWFARANFNYNFNRDTQAQTGVGNVYVVPPGSLAFSGGTWSVAPSWSALTAAQQVAAEADYAAQLASNLNSVLNNNQPAIIARRPRLQEQWGYNNTVQVEAGASYDFAWGKLKPLAGLYYDVTYAYGRLRQNTGSASSPYFQAWDVNPSSPTYFVDQSTSFDPVKLTQLNTNNLAFISDQAAYGVLNGSFLRDTLYVTLGARYNRSQSQTTNFLVAAGTNPVGQGYKTHYTTPQAGIGYKIAKEVLLYASYSQSYTLPAQSFLRTIQTVNGVLQSVPTTQAAPVTGEGYELGVKTDLFNGRISSTLSIYEIKQTNVVQTVNQIVGGITLGTDLQGTKVRSRGVEYEVTWSPLDNWQVFASIAENDIRNTAEPAGYIYYLGAHPQATAKTLANLWTRYSFKNESVKGLWVGGGFNYVSKAAGDNRNASLFVPEYWLWNAAVGYDWTWDKAKLTAALNWENIRNEIYQPANQVRGLPERLVFSLSAKY